MLVYNSFFPPLFTRKKKCMGKTKILSNDTEIKFTYKVTDILCRFLSE